MLPSSVTENHLRSTRVHHVACKGLANVYTTLFNICQTFTSFVYRYAKLNDRRNPSSCLPVGSVTFWVVSLMYDIDDWGSGGGEGGGGVVAVVVGDVL